MKHVTSGPNAAFVLKALSECLRTFGPPQNRQETMQQAQWVQRRAEELAKVKAKKEVVDVKARAVGGRS